MQACVARVPYIAMEKLTFFYNKFISYVAKVTRNSANSITMNYVILI